MLPKAGSCVATTAGISINTFLSRKIVKKVPFLMAEKKQYMPQSSAGLLRYYDEDGGLKIKPQAVVAITLAFIGVVMVLKFLA